METSFNAVYRFCKELKARLKFENEKLRGQKVSRVQQRRRSLARSK